MSTYAGTFLISFTTLALEVTLARMLSVVAWYHLAFFAVSTAMLGMTAGATTLYLKPQWFAGDKLNGSIARACLGYALVTPAALVLLCLAPLSLEPTVMSLLALALATAACALPFYFSGLAISAILTRSRRPIGTLYASDLIGASMGCLFVLAGLDVLDAPSLMLLCGAIGVPAAFCFVWGREFPQRRLAWGVLAVLLVLVPVNAATAYGIRPLVVKGRIEGAGDYLLERWNSFSRVVVYEGREDEPQYWGPSPARPRGERIFQHRMNIDGEAATTLRPFSSLDDIEHLRFDVTNIAYHLRPHGGACIIGVGGGRDIQSAILFGHEKVVGIDVNPIFIDLLRNEFREFAGIADRRGVSLAVGEARTFLARTADHYAVLQMSLVDTWAATGAGAFSLTENSLYTVEAWQTFLARLDEDGIFTVSRWYSPANLGETGRLVSLGVASLLRAGIATPSRHMAMVASNHIATLLISRQPFSPEDMAALKVLCADLQYAPVILPGGAPENAALRQLLAVRSEAELLQAVAEMPLNYEPPTDSNPYFFNMLRLGHLTPILYSHPGVVRGNLIATVTLTALLLCLFAASIATIALPLLIRTRTERVPDRPSRVSWPGALYFSLIGAGFMFVEIGLIQRLSVFLGHPAHALGILLFTIIASTGCGSLLSERLPVARSPWVFSYPVLTAVALGVTACALPAVLGTMMTSPIYGKVATAIVAVLPLGVLMGLFFPTGMRLVQSTRAAETPWYWALNGIFGVSCAALAVFVSMYVGIAANFWIAAGCYGATVVCLRFMYSRSRAASPGAPPHAGLLSTSPSHSPPSQ